MTVEELITKLNAIEDKTTRVLVLDGYGDLNTVRDVTQESEEESDDGISNVLILTD